MGGRPSASGGGSPRPWRDLGGVEVLLDVDGRDVQGRADVVEAEADVVGGEGVGQVEVEARAGRGSCCRTPAGSAAG